MRICATSILSMTLTACTAILGVTDVPDPAQRDAGPGTAPPSFSSAPTILAPAAPVDGEVVSLKDFGGLTGAPPPVTTLQWQRCNASGESCEDIANASAPAYTFAAVDREATVRLRVTAKNEAGET